MQYNNLDYVSVSDENAYAAKAVPVLDINTIYDQSVNTHFSFCVVFPFPIIIMLTVVCFKGACLQLRVKLSNPHNFSSFAALAAMGMLFSFIVVFFVDICALVWAFGKHIGIHENELLQSGFNSTIESHNIAYGTLTIDAFATLFSCVMFGIGLVVECGHETMTTTIVSLKHHGKLSMWKDQLKDHNHPNNHNHHQGLIQYRKLVT